MRRRPWLLAGVALAVALVVVVVLSRRGPDPAERGSAPPETVAAPSVSTPEPTARSCRPGTIRTLGTRSAAEAVLVVRPTAARRSPAGAVVARFGLRNVNGVRTVFGVIGARLGADCRPTWYRVQLPIRPNGSSGWVRAADVSRFAVATRVVVDLSERRVTVLRGDRVVMRARAAIGKPETPTPTGRFYVNQRLLAADPTGPWGPGGVGVSAYSPVLVNWAQGGPIAIHGTNTPHLIGSAVSNGCVRISNYDLRTLMDLAPEGTPVVIRA